MTRVRTSPVTFVLLALVGLLPRAAHSTTFVPMDELTLLRTSDVVIVGTVTAIESAASGPEGAIRTYVHVQPERVVKGAVGNEPIVLREPGGTVGDRSEWVFGAPEFWVGERSLLFLSRNDDGTLQTNNLAMGKFTIGLNSAGNTVAIRDYGYGSSVLLPSTGDIVEAQPETQELEPMMDRLHGMARELPARRRPALRLRPSELNTTPTQFHDAYTFMSSPPVRWFEPDSGLPVSYLVDSTGDSRLGFTSTRTAVDSAFAAWTNVATSNLVLSDGGTTPPGPFNQCNVNRIIFNDPYNEVTDPSGCSGTLAIGGYCSGSGTTVVNGTTFNRIAVGKITFNNGWGSCSFWNQCNVAEVATHELGHTIGLGHSGDSAATMTAVAHFDGRCAGLRSDDINGVSFMYPQTGPVPSLSPTATRTPTQLFTNTPRPTSTPTSVVAAGTPTVTRTVTPTTNSGTSNDACAGAKIISTTPFSDVMGTTLATTSTTDPYPGCGNNSRAKDVWYQFTPPTSGRVVADTFGSTYDTILSVFAGTCGAFAAVSGGCNDDAGYTTQSQLAFSATAGVSYYFMVSAYSGNGGTLTFHLSFQGTAGTATATPIGLAATPTMTRAASTATSTPSSYLTATPTMTRVLSPAIPTSTRPPATPTSGSTQLQNNTCAGATQVSALPYSNTESTTLATTESTDPYPPCGNWSRSKSVWYKFTATSTVVVTASTYGSNYDTLLSAFTGSCGALVAVPGACNDDTVGLTSQVSFTATAGTTYYLMATSYGTYGGTLTFSIH